MHFASIRARTRGATATEYAVMLALVGALAIGTIFALGLSVEDTFTQTDDRLNAGIDSRGPGNGGGNGNGSNPGSTDGNGCYVENGGDSVNRFNPASPITCFDISNGTDSLRTARPGPITITAANGPKMFELNGAGQHTLDLTDVPSGTLDVGQATVTAADSALTVATTGRFEMDATGTAASAWAVQTGNADDSVTVRDGARFTSISLDTGNDGFTFSSPGGVADNPTVALGLGDNAMTLQCGDGAVDWTNTTPIWITSLGNDAIANNGCPMWIDAPAADPSTGAPIAQANLDISNGASAERLNITKTSPYTSFTLQGPVSGSSSISLDTLQSRQMGPVNIDVDYNTDYLTSGPNGPRVLFQVTLNPDLNSELVGPDVASTQPVSIAINTAGAAGADTYTAVVINRPTAQQSVAFTGNVPGTRNINIHFPDPHRVGQHRRARPRFG